MKAWISPGQQRRTYHTDTDCRHWDEEMIETTVEKCENRWLDECKRCAGTSKSPKGVRQINARD